MGDRSVGGTRLHQFDRRRGAEDVATVHRLLHRLSLHLVEERCRLDLCHEGEDRVGLATGELRHLCRQVGLVGLDEDVELDLDSHLVEGLAVRLATASPELVVLVDEVDGRHPLLDDVADELVGRSVNAERRAVDEVVVAVLLSVGNGRSLGADEHRDLGTLRLDHVDDGVGGEDGAEKDVRLVLGHVGDDLLRDVGVGLSVLELDGQLTAEDAACLVDLGHGHLHAEPPVGAGGLVGLVGSGDRDGVAVGALRAAWWRRCWPTPPDRPQHATAARRVADREPWSSSFPLSRPARHGASLPSRTASN